MVCYIEIVNAVLGGMWLLQATSYTANFEMHMTMQSSSGLKKKKAPHVLKSKNNNINRRLLVEFQGLIAFACYDSPSISGGGESMTESTMEKVMTKLCFGNNNDSGSDTTGRVDEIVCYVDQFLLGLNKFKGLYSDIQFGGASIDTAASQPGGQILTMLPTLHRQGSNVNIYVGEGSIEKEFLYRKSLLKNSTGGTISGRTMLRLAKEVLCNCKKMQALVVSSTSPYKNPHEFPSGMNWDDYIELCLNAMYQSEQLGLSIIGQQNDNVSAGKSLACVVAVYVVLHSALLDCMLIHILLHHHHTNSCRSSSRQHGQHGEAGSSSDCTCSSGGG